MTIAVGALFAATKQGAALARAEQELLQQEGERFDTTGIFKFFFFFWGQNSSSGF